MHFARLSDHCNFKKNLFLLIRVLRMNSIPYPQDDYFILIHIYYLAFAHFVTLKHILLAWSHFSFSRLLSFLLLAGHSLNCVPFRVTHAPRGKVQVSLPRLPSLSQNIDFLLWGWSKSLMMLVAVYWCPQWGGGHPGCQSWQAVIALKTGTCSVKKEIKCNLAVSYFTANTRAVYENSLFLWEVTTAVSGVISPVCHSKILWYR